MENKIIYVNGDSFSSGAGLYDHVIVDGYDKLPMLSLGWEGFREFGHKKYKSIKDNFNNDWEKIISEEKKRSWPSKLQDILNIEVINESESGTAMSSIMHRTFLDLQKLANQNKTPNLVIIHLTSIDRISFMKSLCLPSDLKSTGKSYNFIMSYIPHFHVDDNPALMKPWIETFDDNDNMLRFLFEMIYLNLTVKSFTGQYPLYVSTCNKFFDLFKKVIGELELLDRNNFLPDIIESSRIKYYDPDLHMTKYNYGNKHLPCGHFPEETGLHFASRIADYIKDNNLL